VRELRLARKLTQEALAEKLRADPRDVQEIERGVRNLTLLTVARLAKALGVEALQLFVPPMNEVARKPGRPTTDQRRGRGPVRVTFEEELATETDTDEPAPPLVPRNTGTAPRKRR
jgi:transcriptional regulator with XRE-family HTH domain